MSGSTTSTARRPATALPRRCGERGTRSAFDQTSISAGSPTCCGRTNPGTPGNAQLSSSTLGLIFGTE